MSTRNVIHARLIKSDHRFALCGQQPRDIGRYTMHCASVDEWNGRAPEHRCVKCVAIIQKRKATKGSK